MPASCGAGSLPAPSGSTRSASKFLLKSGYMSTQFYLIAKERLGLHRFLSLWQIITVADIMVESTQENGEERLDSSLLHSSW
jgi:hypothetical protein